MTFARVAGRPTEAQRRWLGMMERLGEVHATSVRPTTRRKLIDLGYAEIRCSSCSAPHLADGVNLYHRMTITERGRKYLASWRRAYGAA